MSEDERERQARAQEADRIGDDGDALARAIHERRRRKCIAQDSHTVNCQRCGVSDG